MLMVVCCGLMVKLAEGVGNAPTSAMPILFSRQVQPACICLPSTRYSFLLLLLILLLLLLAPFNGARQKPESTSKIRSHLINSRILFWNLGA
jgi:hypothetical protein